MTWITIITKYVNGTVIHLQYRFIIYNNIWYLKTKLNYYRSNHNKMKNFHTWYDRCRCWVTFYIILNAFHQLCHNFCSSQIKPKDYLSDLGITHRNLIGLDWRLTSDGTGWLVVSLHGNADMSTYSAALKLNNSKFKITQWSLKWLDLHIFPQNLTKPWLYSRKSQNLNDTLILYYHSKTVALSYSASTLT